MTPQELRDLERLVDWSLKRWRERSDYDDMRQEALIGAWQAREKCKDTGAFAASTIIVKAARYAALEWMRSTRSDYPHYGTRRNSDPVEIISLEDMHGRANGAGGKGPGEDFDAARLDPDFAPALLDALEQRAVWVRVMGTVTPHQAAVLRAVYREGKTRAEAARETGRAAATVWRLQREALQRSQERLIPEESE